MLIYVHFFVFEVGFVGNVEEGSFADKFDSDSKIADSDFGFVTVGKEGSVAGTIKVSYFN